MTTDCNKKHLGLAAWLVGLMLLFCLGGAWTAGKLTATEALDATKDHEARLRAVEQTIPRVDQKLDNIIKMLDRHLDDRRAANPPSPAKGSGT